MIRRVEDNDLFSNELLNKLANIIDRRENTIIVDSEEEAIITKKQLNLEGYNVEINSSGNKFKLVASHGEKIRLRDARDSGLFKKLAWGRYSFSRESTINKYNYDFDDGSIWRVIEEDGEEYLIKEINDKTEEIMRFKTANKLNNEINEKNIKNIISIIYSTNDNLIDDILNSDLNSGLMKLANNKLDKEINSILSNNDFIQKSNYDSELKSIVISSIENNQVSNLNQLRELVTKLNNEFILNIGKSDNLFK